MHPRCRPLAVLLALAAMLAACATTAPPQTGLPIPTIAPTTSTLADQLPDGPVIATLHPQRLIDAEPHLRWFFPEQELGDRTLFEAIERELIGQPVSTAGLDRGRPILIGVADPASVETYAEVAYGVAPEQTDFAIALHLTVLLPATEPATLEATVVQLLSSEQLGLQPEDVTDANRAALGERRAFRDGDDRFIVAHGADHVRCDIFIFTPPRPTRSRSCSTRSTTPRGAHDLARPPSTTC